ncbi:hypothetical protein RRG08_054140 [Elysia crispata]|uniref:Uncharacterized protein n=1 Tax=Elysia crispata TaxID=231223 RepID=A0AAE0Y8G2_9GAST|nr:hypothetical protein RRG08_054140 [Elysia crispata]
MTSRNQRSRHTSGPVVHTPRPWPGLDRDGKLPWSAVSGRRPVAPPTVEGNYSGDMGRDEQRGGRGGLPLHYRQPEKHLLQLQLVVAPLGYRLVLGVFRRLVRVGDQAALGVAQASDLCGLRVSSRCSSRVEVSRV